MSAAIIKTEASQKRRNFVSKFLIYFFLIVITACMLLPFLWMLSSSFKLNKDVFGFPIQWIPKKSPLAELCGHLDPDPAADLCEKHGQDHRGGHPVAAVHFLLCSLRLC
mgnify:CR=1 FL=1